MKTRERWRNRWREKQRTPAEISAMEKASAIVVWLEEKNVTGRVRLDKCAEIVDFKKFLSSHKAGLENCEPLSIDWRNFYMRLYTAKKEIENGNNSSDI